MDLIEKATHKGKKLKYEYNGNHYSSVFKRLRNNSAKIEEYISNCEEKLREINADASDSYGDVIAMFQSGIINYKARLNAAMEKAIEYKEEIDKAADRAYDIADKYYKLARDEQRKIDEE